MSDSHDEMKSSSNQMSDKHAENNKNHSSLNGKGLSSA